jgi:peptidoglycan/LPS O-acetylase OafA/YrhL
LIEDFMIPIGSEERLSALDGLRSLAVTWVVFYHYLFFWTSAGNGNDLVAYGNAYAGLPFVSVGYLGVHLFFIISGFVILLTLERSYSLKEFLIRRAIRLWPPLVLFGTLTFAIVGLTGPSVLQVSLLEYLISLAILPPQHIALLIGQVGWKWLDGAYWSLWVEVKFYVIIGIIFFTARNNLLLVWAAYELLTIALATLRLFFDNGLLTMVDGFLFQPYVPYFSFGLASYTAWMGRRNGDARFLTGLAVAHIAALTAAQVAKSINTFPWHDLEFLLGQVGILLLFYVFAWRRAKLPILERPPFVHVGRASYGVYLLHQNVGVTALSAPIFASALIGPIGPLLVFVAVALIAAASFRWFERPTQMLLRRWLDTAGRRGAIKPDRAQRVA